MSITASAAAALNVSSVSTPVVVSDSSANVALYLDSLHTLASASKLASVRLTDTGTPILTTTAAKLITDANALLLVSNTTWNIALSGTATAAQAAAANATLVSKLNAGFAVSDTPSNVALSLAALQALVTGPHKLSSIAFTGSSPVLSITAASLVANAGALGAIITPSYSIAVSSGVLTAGQAAALSTAIVGHLTASVAVSDTSANVTGSLDSLQARAGMIASITLTDSSPAISLTAAQLVADATVLLNISGTYGIVVSGTATAAQAAAVRNPLIVKLTRNLAVSDSANNVVSNLAGLQAHLGFIGSIALTDTTPILSLTASQLNADAGVLLKISHTYSIAMTGTATVAQVTSANVALVSKVTTGFAISDTAVNVATNMNALQASVGAVLSIKLTDASPVLSLTAGQVTADAGILAKISGSYGVTVSDTASATYSNLSALQGLGSKLSTVSVGGTATAAQAIGIAAGLSSHISGTIAVSDSASAVQGALDALQGVHGKIGSILVTSGTVAATAAQMTSDANIIGLLNSVSLSGTATVTQALAIAAMSNLSGTMAVSDTASAVQGALDTLQGIHAKIASIAVTGGTVAATATQMTSDANVIGMLSTVILSGTASVTQAVAIAALAHLSGTIAVSDSATAVQGALDTLQGVHGKIGSIAVTGGTVAATATQITSDASIIGLLSSVSLSGTATVAQAVATAAMSNFSGTIAVSDTASAVQGALDTLQGIHAKITSIAVTGGTVAATAAQMTSDASIIGLLSAVSLSGSATVTQTVAIAVLSNLTGTIAVSDTASAIKSVLDTLQGIHTKIGSIAVTGGTIAATAAQMTSDASVIGMLSAVSLSGTASASQAVAIAALTNLSGTVAVSDTAANVYAARAALAAMGSALGTVTASGTATAAQAVAIATGLSSHISGTIAVSDTASGVQGALDTLQGIHAKIGSIAVTGGTVAATATQMTSDASIIGLLSAVSLSGTATVTQAVAIAAMSTLSGTIAVSDTASAVQGALDTLQGIQDKIASITVIGGPVVATAAQMTSDASIIGLLSAVSLSGSATVTQTVAVAALSNLTGTIAVSDSASAIQSALDTLQGVHGKIGSILVTSGTVAATAAQMTSDANIIGLLSSFGLSGTATVAQAVATAAMSNFSGTIAVSDTASAVQGALDTLQGIHAKITSIAVTGGTVAATAAQMTSDASIIGLLSAVSLSGSATVTQTVAIAALSNLTGTIVISDTASAIQSALDTLQGIHTKVGSIAVTGGTIAATAAQMTSDASVIGMLSAVSLSGTASASQAVAIAALTNLSGTVAVSDTAANVYAARAALAAMGSALGTVTASGTATAAQAVAIATGLSSHISGTIAVSDTASGVQGALDTLQGIHAKIGSIAVTGGTVAATATQITSDASIIGLLSAVSLSGTATVTQAVAIAALLNLTGTIVVSDTASAVQGALDTLQGIQGKIASITVIGGPVVATAAQMTSDANVIGMLATVSLSGTATVSQAVAIAARANLSGTIAVSDTASAVQGALDTLQGVHGKIGSITVTGGTVAATAAQMSSDAGIIGLLSAVSLSGSASVIQALAIAALSNLTGAITISDTASAVQGALDTLQGIHGKIASIAVTGGTVSATATQMSSDPDVIGMLSAVSLSGSTTVTQAAAIAALSNLSGTIAVSDTASTVQAALDTLQGIHGKIGSISVSGGTVTVSATQMSSDAAVIGLLSAVTLSGTASVIQAEAIAVMPNVTGTIAISDTASAVQGALDTLQGVHGKIGSITVTGGPVVATATQMSSDADVIGFLSAISLSGTASVNQAVAIAALSNLTGTIAISDTASAVQSALDTLQGIHGKIGSVAVTGGTVAATAAQMTSDVNVIGLMSAVSLSGSATVNQAVTIAALSNLAGTIAISDTASTVQGALDTLQGIHGKISSIAVTGGSVTATAAQMTSDADVIGLLSAVSLSGPATATQAVAIAALSNLAGTIAVSDTASAVQGTLDTLQGIHANIGSITVTAGTVAATATQMTSDGNVIGLLSAVSLSGSASISQASAIAALSNLTGTIAVSDTASAVQGALDTLQGIHAKIASIAFTGGTVAATATQMSGDASVVALLSAVSQSGTASVTQTVAIAALSNLSGTIAVSDTASAVQGALDTLQGIHAKIGSVVISGGPVVATATQMSSDANVISLLSAVSLSGSASVSQATAIAALSNLSGTIAISDTASAVQGALDTLQGIHGKIASITITGGPVVATATQISADTGVIGLLSSFSLSGTASVTQAVAIAAMSNFSGMIAISDTASAVQGALDTLQGIHGKIASIAVTGGTVAATAAQVSSDVNVIGLLSAVSLSGSASVTQAVAIAALSNLSGTIAVSDTASAVQGALDTLQGVHGKIGSITVSSGTVSATAAQMTSDANVIALLSAVSLSGTASVTQAVAIAGLVNLSGTIAISDTASAVQGALDTLQGIHAKIGSIIATGGTVAATAIQITSDTNVIGLLSAVSLSGTASVMQAETIAALANLSGTIAISDTSSAVQGALDTLQGVHAKIGSIAVTGGTVAATATQLTGDTDVIGLLSVVTLSGTATASQAVTIAALSNLSGTINVSDSGGNIVTGLGGLFTNVGKIGTITVTDSGTALSVASTALATDASVFTKIGTYSLTVSDSVTAATAISINLAYGSHLVTSALTVSDTAAAVYTGLSNLEAVGSKLHTVAVTTATDAASAVAIAAGLSSYITGMINVSDTGVNIVASLSGLHANIGKIGSIVVSDSNTPINVASGQLTTDASVFAAITTYTLTVSDTVTIATVNSINTNYGQHLASGALIVSDTASAVNGDLATLTGLGAKLSSVAVTTAADAATAIAIAGGLSGYISGTINVSDSGGNIVTGLGGLFTNVGKIGTITVTDSGTALSVASTALATDASVFTKIGTYSLTVSDSVTAATAISINLAYGSHLVTSALTVSDTAAAVYAGLSNLEAVGSKLHTVAVTTATDAASAVAIAAGLSSYITGMINVSDTGVNIVASISALHTNIGKIGSIVVSDSNTPINVASGQLTTDASVFAAITTYTLTVSDTVTIATVNSINTNYGQHLASGALIVSDTASAVNGDLATLTGLGAKLSSVAVTTAADAATAIAIAGGLSGYISGTINVSDSGGNIVTGLGGLFTNVGKIGTITVTDSGTALSVASTALATDASVFTKIGTYSLTVSDSVTAATAISINLAYGSHLVTSALTVSDTAAAVYAGLSNLEAVGSKLHTVAVTTATDAASAVAIAAGLSSYITGMINVSDTGGNVYSARVALAGMGSTLGTVIASGAVMAAQAVAIATSLSSHISGMIVVSDTGANVVANLSGLFTNLAEIGTITVSDASTPLVVTSTDLATKSAVFTNITGYTLTVSDPLLTATVASISASYGSHLATGALTVSDTAANVSGYIDALQTLGSKVSAIALTDGSPVISLNAAQLISDELALLKIGGAYQISVSGNANVQEATFANTTLVSYLSAGLAVSDTVANVGGSLAGLQTLVTANKLASITVTGGGTIGVSAGQLLANSNALALISGTYSLTITSGTLTAAQATSISPSILSHLSAALPVQDTSSNIVSHLNGLQGIFSSIHAITFTDTTPTLSLTAATISNDFGALSLASGYSLSVSGGAFTAAQAATLSTTTSVAANMVATSVVVVDTAAAISGALSSLATLAGTGKLGPITLSDVSVLPVTPAQLLADLAVFRKITNSYSFSVSSALTADQAATISPLLMSRLPASLAVTDSAAHIYADLDSLEALALGGHLGAVTLNDGGTPQLHVTGDQLTSDADALNDIVSAYQFLITGSITAAQAASFAGQPSKLAGAVSVLDTAAAVTSSLAGLGTVATNNLLSAITLTDTGIPSLSLTASAFDGGGLALKKIVGSYSVTIASGTLTAAQLALAATRGLLGFVSGGFNLADAASAIATDLALGASTSTILTHLSSITSITVTSGPLTLTLTVAEAELTGVAGASGVINDISGNGYTVTGAAVSDLSTLQALHYAPTHITLSDTANNIAADLGGGSSAILAAPAGQITSITVTSGPLTLTVAEAELAGVAGASGVINDISGNGYTVTGAAVSDLSTLQALHYAPTHITLSDTANNIAADLGGGSSAILAAPAGQITSITVTSGPLTLTVAEAELTGVAGASGVINDITGNGYTVTGAAVSDLSTLQALHYAPTHITLSDTANNIAADLGGGSSAILAAPAGQITSITVTSGPLTLTVAEAELTGVAGASGVINDITGNGYTVTGAAVSDLSTLQALHYAPTHITLSDTANNIAADLGGGSSAILAAPAGQITSITVTSGPLTLTVAEAELAGVAGASGVINDITGNAYTVTGAAVSDLSTLQALHYAPTHITLSDTANNIAADLGGGSSAILAAPAGQITSITVTSGPLTLTVAEAELTGVAGASGVINDITGNGYTVTGAAVSDLSTLQALHYAPTHITLSDTANNIAADLGGGSSAILAAPAGQITSITVTSGPLTLTVAEAELAGVAGASGVINDISGNGYTVTGAAVSDLSTLQALHYAPTHITLSDTANNIAADLGGGSSAILAAPAGQITSITVTSGPLTLTVAEAELTGVAGASGVINDITGNGYTVTGAAVSDLSTLQALHYAPTHITLSDTANNIAADLGGGSSAILAAPAGQITSITVTSGPLTLTVAEAELTGVAGASGVINDISGNAYTVTGAAVSDLSTLQALHYAPTHITLSDTANNIAADLGGGSSAILAAPAGQITSITVTSGPLTLTVAEAELAGVAGASGVINDITGNGYTVTGAAVSDLSTLQALHYAPTHITLSDTANNIAADLGGGSSAILAAPAGQITSITVTSGPLTLTVAEAELAGVAGASGVINDISGNGYTVTGAAVSDLSTLQALHYAPTHITLSDTANNIAADLGGGSSAILAAPAGQITSITVTSGPLTLTVAEAELAGVAGASGVINDITGNGYTVTGAAVSDLSTLQALHYAPTHITLSDTANNIAADLGGGSSAILAAPAGQITSITVTSGPLTLTVAEAELTGVAGASGVINDITGNGYTVTGAAVSDLSTLQALHYAPTHITLSDTANNIAADLGGGSSAILAAPAGQITSITVTSGPLTLTVAEAELAGVAGASGVINDITGNAYTVTGAAVSDLSTLQALHYAPTHITLSDTANNIAADLGGGSSAILAAPAGQITSITVTSGPLTLTVAEAELTGVAGASGVINDITGNGYTVTGAAVSDLSTLQALHYAPTHITLEDTAAHILTDLALGAGSTILAASSLLAAITIDSGPLSLTMAELHAVVQQGLGSLFVGTINASGTGSSMIANIDALQALNTAGSLGTLTMTTAVPAMNVTAAQVNNDTVAINHVMSASGANSNAVLYVQGTTSADTVDASALTHVTDISLGTNSATMSFVSGGADTVNGMADNVTLGSAASTVEYTANSGVEVINGFQFGTDVLNFALGSVSPADLSATDITLNGTTAVAVTVSDYPAKGVVLVNPGVSASALISDHVFAAGNHSVIS